MTSEVDRNVRRGKGRGFRREADDRERKNPFVNVNLSEEQEADKRVKFPDAVSVFEALSRAVESGYSVSIKWDEYSSSPAAFLRSSDDHPDNGGLVLSGRGGTPGSALREVLYLHYVVLLENWLNAKPRTSRDFAEDDF